MLTELRLPAHARMRTFRKTLLSALGMAAIVLGLLAMHSAGSEHVDVAGTSATAVVPHTHDEASTTAVSDILNAGIGAVLACDAGCMQGLVDCAMMVMGCAMLLTIAVLIVLAHRPGIFRALQDAGGHIITELLQAAPPHALRPSLIVLSISRT